MTPPHSRDLPPGPPPVRTALLMLAIPITIALTSFFVSGSLQLAHLLRLDMSAYVMPAFGLLLSFLCATLLLRGRVRIARLLIIVYLGLAIVQLIASIALLVMALTDYRGAEGGFRLLLDSVLLWLFNMQIFALAYWTLDGSLWTSTGRHMRRHFFFPQQVDAMPGYERWEPDLFAYIFLAFTTSATYGPTDMPAASHAAKLLMMIQAMIALILFTLTIARAVSLIG